MRVALLRAGVPARYGAATWDQVEVQEAREWRVATTLLPPRLRRGQGLLIAGPVGTGKSSIAALICREVLALRDPAFSVRWEYFPAMLDELETRQTRMAVQHRQVHKGLVVWDDFGVDRLAEWQIPLLDRIVERRYAANRAMIVTTNVDPALLAADVGLARITSRWRQRNGPALHVHGPDRRRREQ